MLKINKTFPDVPWLYCPTNDNLAALLTRELNATEQISSRLWQFGPSWLTNEALWPAWNHSEVLHLQVNEGLAEADSSTVELCSAATPGIHNLIQATNYSTLSRLLCVSAYVARFIYNTMNLTNRKVGPLSVDETNKALNLWVHSCQHTLFHKEVLSIQSKHVK